MNSIEIDNCYKNRKNKYFKYINDIKSIMTVDIYSIINTTLIKNPYNHDFPLKFFLKEFKKENKFRIFIKSCLEFYIKQFYYFISYIISFFIFKIIYKKKSTIIENHIILDIYLMVDTVVENKKFDEKYFSKLYEVLDKYEQKYIFLPRLYGVSKNPFKLIKLFKIINKDKRNFIFEFEFITHKDIVQLLFMICKYPFKTLRLMQKERTQEDILFNNELIKDIPKTSIDAFTRYILGKNLSELDKIKKIYSWGEFQVTERSFNYGIRTNNQFIKLYGCQFYINYDTYFSTHVDDLDDILNTAYHNVLVNGKYYILSRNKINYKEGVSLRYNNLFNFKTENKYHNILVLGSYFVEDTKYLLKCVKNIKNVIFKSHPAVRVEDLDIESHNIKLVNENIYELFKKSNIVISTASGTLIEAVSSGLSVIIIASQTNLTGNPLVDFGKGKIWDIAFSEDEVSTVYNKLLKYREKNLEKINEIALWYKDNFFIEPSEENIKKTFEIGRN